MKSSVVRSKNERGVGFIIWILVLGIVFWGVVASLLSGITDTYSRGVDQSRRLKALYLAESGVSRAVAIVKREGIHNKSLEIKFGQGIINLKITPDENGAEVLSTGTIERNGASYSGTVSARLEEEDDSILVKDYKWTNEDGK